MHLYPKTGVSFLFSLQQVDFKVLRSCLDLEAVWQGLVADLHPKDFWRTSVVLIAEQLQSVPSTANERKKNKAQGCIQPDIPSG